MNIPGLNLETQDEVHFPLEMTRGDRRGDDRGHGISEELCWSSSEIREIERPNDGEGGLLNEVNLIMFT